MISFGKWCLNNKERIRNYRKFKSQWFFNKFILNKGVHYNFQKGYTVGVNKQTGLPYINRKDE